jgi:hypothetical protein
MVEARGLQGTAGRVGAQSPARREAGFGATRQVAHRSPPSKSGATANMVASEPFSRGRRVLEPLDT